MSWEQKAEDVEEHAVGDKRRRWKVESKQERSEMKWEEQKKEKLWAI